MRAQETQFFSNKFFKYILLFYYFFLIFLAQPSFPQFQSPQILSSLTGFEIPPFFIPSLLELCWVWWSRVWCFLMWTGYPTSWVHGNTSAQSSPHNHPTFLQDVIRLWSCSLPVHWNSQKSVKCSFYSDIVFDF